MLGAAFGVALCRVELVKRLDSSVKYPSTLIELIECLKLIQCTVQNEILEHTTRASQLSWLVWNGLIHMFTIAKPLITLGFAQNVVDYLNWCILGMESIVSFCTTKYLPWRVTLYATVCDAYEQIAQMRPELKEQFLQAAIQCIQRGEDKIKQLTPA